MGDHVPPAPLGFCVVLIPIHRWGDMFKPWVVGPTPSNTPGGTCPNRGPTPLGGHGPQPFPSSTTINQQKSCPQPCPPRPRWAFCTVLIHPPAGGTWSNLGFLAQPPPTHLGGHVQIEAPPRWGDMIHVPLWAWVFHLRLGCLPGPRPKQWWEGVGG